MYAPGFNKEEECIEIKKDNIPGSPASILSFLNCPSWIQRVIGVQH